MQEIYETQFRSLCRENPWRRTLATPSSILAWSIPWTEEHHRLQSTGSQTWLKTQQQIQTQHSRYIESDMENRFKFYYSLCYLYGNTPVKYSQTYHILTFWRKEERKLKGNEGKRRQRRKSGRNWTFYRHYLHRFLSDPYEGRMLLSVFYIWRNYFGNTISPR